MRSLGRFFLTSGFTTFPAPVQAQARQYIGPALNLPVLDPTLALRIIHAFANLSDAAQSNFLFLNHAAIELVATGPAALIRVRILEQWGPAQNGGLALGVGGAWFGRSDREMVLGTDYRELTTFGIPTTAGSFQIRLESELVNSGGVAQTLTVNLGVLFELFQRGINEAFA